MASSYNRSYNLRAAFVLGSLIFLTGVIGIYVQMSMHPQKLDFIDKSSAGFWTSIIFLSTGALTLVSWKNNTSGMITMVMVVSIVTSVVCAAGISLTATFWGIGGVPGSGNKGPAEATGNNETLSELDTKEHEDALEVKDKLALDLLLVQMALFIVEGVFYVVLSAFCCGAVCCGAGEEEPAAVPITTGASQTQPKYQPPGSLGAENPTVRRRRSVDGQ